MYSKFPFLLPLQTAEILSSELKERNIIVIAMEKFKKSEDLAGHMKTLKVHECSLETGFHSEVRKAFPPREMYKGGRQNW